MLDFTEASLIFKFNGEQYEVNYPTINEFIEFRKSKIGDRSEIEICRDFVTSLGLDENIVGKLRLSQLNALIEELTLEKQLSKKN